MFQSHQPDKPRQSRPIEKAMIGMTGVWIVGILIYGFVPPGAPRTLAMLLFIGALAYYIYNPLGFKKLKK